MSKEKGKNQFKFKEVDLNDPTTKALYDIFPEDKKEKFEDAYIYAKYLQEAVSVAISCIPSGIPMNEEAQKLAERSPDIVEHMKKYGAKILKSKEDGLETSFYNPKVVELKNAIKLVTQEVDINLEVPLTVMPFKLARNIILKSPTAIAVGKCPCRAANPDCKCMPEPYEVCFFIGDPIASFIAANNKHFRKVTQEEAVEILKDCHKRGFVSEAFFKTDMGNRFYAICNCCSCCCGGVIIDNMFLDGKLPYFNAAPSGCVAEIGDDCVGCEECVDKCQFHAIKLNEDKSRAEVSIQRCMGCGVCEDQCPSEAITMRVEPSKGGILDLDELRKITGTGI